MDEKTYEEDWAVYFSTIDENQIGSILVDLGLNNIAPVESKANLITITTFMNDPNEDGLSSAKENDILNEIEDGFIDFLVSRYDAVYPGRLKYKGKILSYFYSAKTNEIENTIVEIRNKFPQYRFEFAVKEEKDWRAYFEVLYPSEFEMQVIQNGRAIANLEKHGDRLKKERQVDHWIYFKTETDRKNFLDSIKNQGFEIIKKEMTSFGEFPFSLQLARVDKVDYENVNEYVMYLWGKSQEFGGDYDGWETSIIKE